MTSRSQLRAQMNALMKEYHRAFARRKAATDQVAHSLADAECDRLYRQWSALYKRFCGSPGAQGELFG